jgi:hypothetical protein
MEKLRCWAGLALFVLGAPAAKSADGDLFESKVRPILANNCYACHAALRLGGLRVDSREELLKGGASGPAIVPGDPEKSLLIRAVRQTDEKLKMPQGGKLDKEEVDALVEWVRAGAPWPESKTPLISSPTTIRPEERAFWSFQPLRKPAAPPVDNQTWPRTDIDRFVLAALEKQGMKPVAAADKRTLLRRVTLDLTGLPPSPEEFAAFEQDASPDAFAKVVDRLLASPQYGERWGRFWLDVARYGEDDYRSLDPMRRGYNPYPNAYLYRDWVVKAFNDDLPYDQFVKAQLAADQMDESRGIAMLPGLGFLGLGPWYYDNGAVEITHADERHDRVDVVSRGFLGLTVGCARCHDHKYDPVSTRDYYALAGVFGNTQYTEIPLAPKATVEEFRAKKKLLEAKEELLGEITRDESLRVALGLVYQASQYMVAVWKVTGEPKEEAAKVVEAGKLETEVFDRWLKFLAKPPKFYPYLTAWQEMVKRGGTLPEAKKLAAEFEKLLIEIALERREVNDENDIIKAKALPGTKKKKAANLPNEFLTNDDFCPGCGLSLKAMEPPRSNLWTDVFQRDLQDGFDPSQAMELVKPGLLAFRGWGLERRLSAERRAFLKALGDDVDAMGKEVDAGFPYAHAVSDVETPVNLKVHIRGNPFNLGDEVPRGFPAVLSQGEPLRFQRGSGRMELAEAILRQPIAMRVIVNRIWKQHFGTGLVDTPSNFGVAGERPSDPDLLEYLAQFFVDNGMSIKKLHREMVLSAVYQLSTTDSAENFERDAGNRYYWRANRKRMDAEQLRDSLLSVSGALENKMGGPPAELTPGYSRRTLYGKVSRYRLDEYLQLFDFPSPNQSAEKRFTTNVPLQRLFLMNSDFAQQQSELLARKLENEPDMPSAIRKAYSILYGRAPSQGEIDAGAAFLRAEPLVSFEERKAAKERADAEAKAKGTAAPPPESKIDGADDAPPAGADSMMAGVKPGARRKAEEAKMLPVTPLGRYLKVLLSNNEFLYID